MSPPVSTQLHPREPRAGSGVRQRAPFRAILAVGSDPVAEQAAVAMARLTGSRLLEPRPDEPGAGRSLAALARREAADLVVVAPGLESSADIAGLLRPALDSQLVVLVIPAGAPAGLRLERIGVGYDGGPAAQRALSCAAELIGLAGPAVASVNVAYVDDAFQESRVRGLEPARCPIIEWWLESVGEDLRAPVTPLRLEGDPAEALADLSQDLDLLVVGTRPRGWLRRLVAGSVSTGLLARTRCPLLVVPERSAAARLD